MDFLKHLHSGLRWVVLLLLVMAVVNAFKRWKSGESYGAKDKVLNLFSMISVHTQLLIGLILYFAGDMGVKMFKYMSDNATARFFAVEHITMMVLAIVLITVGRKRAQAKSKDAAKHRLIFIWYVIALIIILAAIPWPFLSKFSGSGYF